MPLSEPAPRTLCRRRAIDVAAFPRDDGRWRIDVRLTHPKPYGLALATGVRPLGKPVAAGGARAAISAQRSLLGADVLDVAADMPIFQPGHGDTLRFEGETVRRFHPRRFYGRANDRANEATTGAMKASRDGTSARTLEPKLPT